MENSQDELIAKAYGIDLGYLYDEEEAVTKTGVSKSTLKRRRKNGCSHHFRGRTGRIRYLGLHLIAILKGQ